MRAAVILSGTILDDCAIKTLLSGADLLICADGGAGHLRRLERLPDLLIGDMDSIIPEDLAFFKAQNIPVCEYPVVKDQTDAELAIMQALDHLPAPPQQHEIMIIGAFGSRPDHVLANQMLVARLAEQGWRFLLTDGRNSIYTLIGGQQLVLDRPDLLSGKLAVSVIPISGQITGLTYSGLSYPLREATLSQGSTRGVSNRIEKIPVTITMDTGTALIIVTPEE